MGTGDERMSRLRFFTEADGNGLYYLGSLVYSVQNGAFSLESAAFDGGRFFATSSGVETRYYIADHLGSVRVVVAGNGEVIERNDFYPFGLKWNNDAAPIADNRYRYNAKEEQAFLSVPYIDYGARMYDPKYNIRWNSVDPLAEKYLYLSPFAFCAGNPVKYIDRDGEKIYFAPGVSQEFKDKFALTIQYMNERGSAGDIATLEKSHNIYWISEGDAHFNPRTNTISWNPQQILKTDKDIYLFPATILAHEVRHGRQKEEKTPVEFQEQSQKNKQNPYENNLEEEVITTTEQHAARKHGDISANQTTRENHQGQLIEISTSLPNGKIMEDYRISIINQLP